MDTVGQYLHEIGTTALLDAQQERELSQKIEKGRDASEQLEAEGDKLTSKQRLKLRRAIQTAEKARDHFIRANLRLVVSIARRYPLPPTLELLDLIQEGNLGLEHAVEKFDWRKGFKFSTYATFWIRQSIGRALDQKGSLIRLPSDRSAALRAALRTNGGNHDALDDENALLQRVSTPTSLDKTVGEDGDSSLIDLIGDTNAPNPHMEAEVSERRDVVSRMLRELDDRTRNAVAQRYGFDDDEPRSYREIGSDLGITAEAARRLVKRAIDELQGRSRDGWYPEAHSDPIEN